LAWTIEYTKTAQDQLAKLDKPIAQRIMAFMATRIARADHPRRQGKALTGVLGGFWRYRVGDYRIVCDIQDGTLRILVVMVGHRNKVYQ